jgi:hypothetical protein
MKIFFVLSLTLISTLACQRKEKTFDETLRRSVEWMWQQQSVDGGWHSQTHAILRDGKVLTPYILYHLMQVPEEIYPSHSKSIDRAARFIIDSLQVHVQPDKNTLQDYPNYSAAYALRVLHDLDRDTTLQRTLANYLLSQQFTEERGFTKDNLVYGGWGYGEEGLAHGRFGHVDISHTRRVLEALTETRNLTHDAHLAAMYFIKSCQRDTQDIRVTKNSVNSSYDGGFVSSSVTLSTNKSIPMVHDEYVYYPSYATATCDGMLALSALHENGQAFTHAAGWLMKNNSIHHVDGLGKDDPEQWSDIMHYYHLSVRGEAMSLIDPQGLWKDSIQQILTTEQIDDSYYINPLGGVNKEDDPLMATILCIQAGTKSLD